MVKLSILVFKWMVEVELGRQLVVYAFAINFKYFDLYS